MVSRRPWPGRSKRRKTSFGGLLRSALMSRIKGQANASTEMAMMNLLRGSGVEGWRRHMSLPGRPDFGWRRERVALFVDGCFWHGCRRCLAKRRGMTPSSNALVWKEKIARNRRRDQRVARELRAMGWAVARVWEHELRKRPDAALARVATLVKKASRRRHE